MDRIDILLATYNGAAFLEPQLDSIEAQTHKNWRLIARDDGSTDRTLEILSAFQARHARKVEILADDDGNLGLVRNFSRLMEHSDAPYTTFCDQDDVWIPEKLELCLEKMRELEREHGAETPLLVFTDLTVVDEGLRVIHPSFWRYQKLDPNGGRSFSQLLVMNVVTGCAALANRSLARIAAPVPSQARVHDWWMALTVAAFGYLAPLFEPTVLYRQHGNQSIGAKALNLWNLPRLVAQFVAQYSRHKALTSSLFAQGTAFRKRFGPIVTEQMRRELDLFLRIEGERFDLRLRRAVQVKCLPESRLRALKFLIMS